MRAVIQRVAWAEVAVEGRPVARIGPGLLVLLGVGRGDDEGAGRWLAEKVAGLRLFDDAAGRMNRSLAEVGGEVLAVSQFTLYGDVRRGRRPSFDGAAPPEVAKHLCEKFVDNLAAAGVRVKGGVFGARMAVSLLNDGPVTLLLERGTQRHGLGAPPLGPEEGA